MNIMRPCLVRGFWIALMSTDMQFKQFKDRNLGVPTNIVSRTELAQKIKRWYRGEKERARCYYSPLPFRHLQ